MEDDLGFDEIVGADCHECEHDSRYCYVHRNERDITRRAVEGWRKLKRMRAREMGDDIRTTELAIQLRDMGDKLDDITAHTARLIAAAEHDEKLLELRVKVARAAGHAKYCWQEYALAEEQT